MPMFAYQSEASSAPPGAPSQERARLNQEPVRGARIVNIDGSRYQTNSGAFDLKAVEGFHPLQGSGDAMADMTREEIDAKLATVEARGETRFIELSGKMDRVMDTLGALRSEISSVRNDNKFTRITIIVAVVGSVIAGLAALWVTQSNMLASFLAGLAAHDAASPNTRK